MDPELLQRVMDLAERTGDRVIIVNPESGMAHAVMPFDAYEELVDGGTASLRDLDDDFDFKEKDDDADLDDMMGGIMVPDEATKEALQAKPMTDEEIDEAVKHDLDIIKMAEESQKEAGGTTSLDILDDEANEEQYYLEPIE